MNFYLIGISYKTGILAREELFHRRKEIEDFWLNQGVEFSVFATCNRFDINIFTEGNIDPLIKKFKQRFPQFAPNWELKHAKDALAYGMRLACGLESQIKGERQILEQLGNWLNQAGQLEKIHNYWSEIIQKAQDIRLQSGLESVTESLADILFQDLKAVRGSISGLNILIIGTGNVARLIVKSSPEGSLLSFAAHKNRLKAEFLARHCQGKVIGFNRLSDTLLQADLVISATSSPHFIISTEEVKPIIARRKCPLYIYDLGFPRDIPPDLKFLKMVILRNMDDLERTFSRTSKILGILKVVESMIGEALKKDVYFEVRNPAQLACIKAG